MRTTPALVVVAKSPRPGEVKTRLCPPLVAEDAAAVHEAFLRDTMDRARSLAGVDVVCAYSPPEDRRVFEALCDTVRLVPQEPGDLGERLRAIFATVTASGLGPAVAIGADTPTLPLGYLREAFRRLADPRVDAVIGPADDGGYYLIGLRQARPELFLDIPWSTDRVFAETRRRADARGLRVDVLSPWRDVDTFDDLARLVQELREEPARARHSHAALTRLGLL